jgi:hypothetical protein
MSNLSVPSYNHQTDRAIERVGVSANPKYQNQHYISQVLQRRFCIDGMLQRYSVQYDSWRETAPTKTFSYKGYTQLLTGGTIDHTLEVQFSQIENEMPGVFAALDDAATRSITELPVNLFEVLCWYMAFVHCLSPFFKASCPEDFLDDLHCQLINEKGDLLSAIKFKKWEQQRYRDGILNGQKIIIDSPNCLQFLHRIQFNRLCKSYYYLIFRHVTAWHLCRSPIELPLGDVAITPILAPKIHWYNMPISPTIFLVGRIPQTPENKVSVATFVYGVDLPPKNAENWKDMLCLQAGKTLISRYEIPDVKERSQRAIEAGHAFAKIHDIDKILTAGMVNNVTDLKLKLVSHAEYKAFTNQFVIYKGPSNTLAVPKI